MTSDTPQKTFLLTITAVGGLLLGLSFPPFPLPLAACVALFPLLVAWRYSEGWAAGLLYGVVFYTAAFAVAFSWPLRHAMPSVAFASVVPLLYLIFVLAVPVGLSRTVAGRLGEGAGMLAFIGLHISMEAALSYGPFAMPWPLLGNVFSEVHGVRQLAAYVGVTGLSALVLSVNVLLYWTAFASGIERAVPAAALVVVLALGFSSLTYLVPPQPVLETARVAVVQPSLSPAVWSAVHDRTRVDTLLALTDSILSTSGPAPDLVVWPETSLPPCPEDGCADVEARIAGSAGRLGVPLLTGGIVEDARRDSLAVGRYRNAALMFSENDSSAPSDGSAGGRYDKIRLVPFAEEVPLARHFPALERLAVPAGGIAGYDSGDEHRVLQAGAHRIGVLICFESLFPQDARAYARDSVDFLVILSQDGWWGRSAGYRQHLAFTRLRAVETRRPVVFATASGTSAVIGPDGKLLMRIAYGERTAVTATLPIVRGTSPFVRYGDWITPGGILLSVVLLIMAGGRRSSD